MWNHAHCIMKKKKQIKSVDDVEGLELLRWEDQQTIRKYVDGVGQTDSVASPALHCGIEVSPTSRATCRYCNQKITKGEVEKFSGWESLSATDRATVTSLVTNNASALEGTKVDVKEEKNMLQDSTSKSGNKRKRAFESDPKPKNSKDGGNSSSIKLPSENNVKNVEGEPLKESVLESQLEDQTKALWELKDDLKKHVTSSELREMLEVNDQDLKGSELDLRERCADGMLFGALSKCPLCSGWLRYSSGMYRCCGYLSEWSKCSYSTAKPQRVKGKWKIPEETSNDFLLKLYRGFEEDFLSDKVLSQESGRAK
ncbi:poly [ADP-ribose] polymerase 1-like [Primulina eburnea]|uniref:poly [ADP-ribose] polymerase 1-like n=1 Tax=Primulina eburnea TaxID=1245227 RepID=UPI003C6CBB67